MSPFRKRLSLVEYGTPIDLVGEITGLTGFDRAKSNSLLTNAGNRVASSLGLRYNPIQVDAKGTRAIDFAGLIRIGPSLELEIAPKFLGSGDITWREDFFFLSTLSKHGHLLSSEHLSATGGATKDLSTLVARAMTGMYEARKRRPLRSYRRMKDQNFFLDGDVDPVELCLPSADGFDQEVLQFDRQNCWNADLVAAARELLPEVSDPAVVNSLVRLIEELSPQAFRRSAIKPIPTRHRSWKPLHELSLDVLGGLGLSYQQGHSSAPGYLIATWRVWEDLLTVSARLGFGHSMVAPQQGYALGVKSKPSVANVTKLSVFPDCVIETDGVRPRILLDAKYKGHVERGSLRIAESDVYEAIAFSKATSCNNVVLAYPAQANREPLTVGACIAFEKIKIDHLNIIGVEIESRQISKKGALEKFAHNLSNGLSTFFADENS